MNIKKLTIILFLLFGITGCQSDTIEKFLLERPASTIAQRQFISNWDQPNAKKIPVGVYSTKESNSKGINSVEINLTYYITKQTITIHGAIDGTTAFVFPLNFVLDAEANYSLNEGLITFTNTKGHRSLFPADGSPYEIEDDGTITIYDISENGVVTKHFLVPVLNSPT